MKIDARVLVPVFALIAGRDNGRKYALRLANANPAPPAIDIKVSSDNVLNAMRAPAYRKELPPPLVDLDASEFKSFCSYVANGGQGRSYALHVVNACRNRLGYRKPYERVEHLPKVEDPEHFMSKICDQLNKAEVKR